MPDSSRLPTAIDRIVEPILTSRLQQVLPAACAEHRSLPDVPEIALWLLNADFSSAALTRDEMAAVLEYPAYWAFCWASGQVLARWLLDHPQEVAGRTVLDFGCGSGIAAIAAAKAGAARVLACDLDPDALLATGLNAELNQVELELCDDFNAIGASIDLILVADVLYDRANLSWLPRFLGRADRVVVADSRIKHFDAPGYKNIGRLRSSTWPDLDEFDEFRDVTLYLGEQP
ncbi:MAG: 50S ribosomal protein L11 methyltransferase [Spongiibacteraceae bacterium]